VKEGKEQEKEEVKSWGRVEVQLHLRRRRRPYGTRPERTICTLTRHEADLYRPYIKLCNRKKDGRVILRRAEATSPSGSLSMNHTTFDSNKTRNRSNGALLVEYYSGVPLVFL
jgi:hypothetical protein